MGALLLNIICLNLRVRLPGRCPLVKGKVPPDASIAIGPARKVEQWMGGIRAGRENLIKKVDVKAGLPSLMAPSLNKKLLWPKLWRFHQPVRHFQRQDRMVLEILRILVVLVL